MFSSKLLDLFIKHFELMFRGVLIALRLLHIPLGLIDLFLKYNVLLRALRDVPYASGKFLSIIELLLQAFLNKGDFLLACAESHFAVLLSDQ